MKHKHLKQILKTLKARGISFDQGLRDDEVLKIESRFGFQFPPDLRLLLQTALPVSPGFVHWRYALNDEQESEQLRRRIAQPVEGILFDIKHNDFWFAGLGEKPAAPEEKTETARRYLVNCPKLIPIYRHRYLPEQPIESGNPVFSVYGTDIIYIGYDLASYFANEFHFELADAIPQDTVTEKKIRCWSDLVM